MWVGCSSVRLSFLLKGALSLLLPFISSGWRVEEPDSSVTIVQPLLNYKELSV